MTKKQFDVKKSFEELQKTADWFSKEDIDLNEGLKRYEKGMQIIKEVKKHLKEFKNEIKKVKSD